MCSKGIEYEGITFTDIFCPHCGVLNSVLNPASQDWLKTQPKTTYDEWLSTKEDSMPFDADVKQDSQFLKLPKQGESYDFSVHGDIAKIEKIANPDGKKGFNFTKKVQVTTPDGKLVTADDDQGYFYLMTFADGKKLSLSSWSPFFAMKEVGIAEGMSFQVEHKEKGKWIVEKV
jgi:hypothetical protein